MNGGSADAIADQAAHRGGQVVAADGKCFAAKEKGAGALDRARRHAAIGQRRDVEDAACADGEPSVAAGAAVEKRHPAKLVGRDERLAGGGVREEERIGMVLDGGVAGGGGVGAPEGAKHDWLLTLTMLAWPAVL